MQILNQRQKGGLSVVGNLHNAGNLAQSRELCRTKPPFARNHFVAAVLALSYAKRLNNAVFSYRVGESHQFPLVKFASWLKGTLANLRQGKRNQTQPLVPCNKYKNAPPFV